jgi:hypothetical protein
MADCQMYIYEVMKTRIETNQEVMVQIFREPDTLKVIHAQIAFKNAVGDSWGVPYQLEVAE